jgi:transcriptional regulator with XRE-family HTH domain
VAREEDADERQERLRSAGSWLRTQRELRGWNGSDLARRLDLNQVRISAYERGQYEVPSNIAEAIAVEFDMPVIEVRRNLGLWVPSDSDLNRLQHYADPEALADEALLGELIRRYQKRSDREVLDVWPRRSEVPRELWDRLILGARSDIFLAGYTNYFFWTERPNFSDVLRRKAQEGVRVRILVGDPDGEVTRRRELVENAPLTIRTRIGITLDELAKLGQVPGLEVKISEVNAEAHVSRSIFQFDREVLVCEHIAERLGHGSLTYHLRRMATDGPFDQYVAHADHLWRGARDWKPSAARGDA